MPGETSLGREIRRLREASGLTLGDLSARAGMREAYVAAIEQDREEPSAGALRRLAHHLEPAGANYDELARLLTGPEFDPGGEYGHLGQRDVHQNAEGDSGRRERAVAAARRVWSSKTDLQVAEAAAHLDEYSEEARPVILAELDRRRRPEMEAQHAPADDFWANPLVENTDFDGSAPAIPNQKGWLVRRVLLALALMAGFYVLALVIGLGLLWIPYAEWAYVGRVDLRIAIFCVGGAVGVLGALVPRVDRFDPPGPRLDESAHPKLFQTIRRVAAATGQTEPGDVFLLNEVNAWVAHRGGVMGFGSQRVMGVGFPLLQALSVPEFEAIIAHEFGHYASGDLKLAPWIYKTRAAIGRALAAVRGRFFEAPFRWYARTFLRLTQDVSRQQELFADQLAARVAGAPALAMALRQVTALAPAYGAYLSQEVGPVMQAGFLPPIVAGFDEFLENEHVAGAVQRIVEAAEASGQTRLFDTHPSLKQRLAALGATQRDTAHAASMRARTLIATGDEQARLLLEFAFGAGAIRNLKPIDWSQVGESVYVPAWRGIVRSRSLWLSRYVADDLPVGRNAFVQAGSALVDGRELGIDADTRIGRAVYLLAVGISVLLLDQGWRAHTRPGKPVLLMRGSDTFEPQGAVRSLTDAWTVDAWRARCLTLGIAGKPLAAAAPPQQAGDGRAVRAPRAPTRPTPRADKDEVLCWQCKHALATSAENRGKTVKCPQCGTRQQLPKP